MQPFLKSMMEDLDRLRELLNFPKDILILSHRNPDGDALGSSLGLKKYLSKYGHKIDIIFPSEFPTALNFHKGTDDIVVFDFEKDKTTALIEKCQMIFFLDFSSLDRIDNLAVSLIERNVPKIHIDHHLDPEPIADFTLTDSTASSTSELIYRFIGLLDNGKNMDADIAEAIMAGIIADTGSFRYSVSPETFRVCSELMKYNFDFFELQNNIFNCLTDKQLRLIAYSLDRKMEYLPDHKTAIISLSKQDYKDFDIQRGDTEGLVNYPLMVRDVKISALITEQPTITKISLRSKGNISVQEISKKHFKGGGHLNAAGGQSFAKLEEVVAKLKKVLPEFVKN